MAYNIYHKNGTLLTTTHRLTHHDSFMGENYVSVDIKSPSVIGFAIGDYIDYRGHRYYMAVTPSVKKRARQGSVGGAFEYESVKFTSAAGYDLTRIKFRDIVPSALASTYHTNFAATTFAIYCESLITFGERLKANLDRVCKDDEEWTVLVRMQGGSDYECGGDFAIDHASAMGEKGVAITISDEYCWDAMKHIPDNFKVNFFIVDRTIVLGANAGVVNQYFHYGKGNGVFSFKRSTDDSQAVVTIARAYGSEKNMPLRYYNNKSGSSIGATINVKKLMLPGFGVTPLADVVSSIYANSSNYATLIGRIQDAVELKYGVRPATYEALTQYIGFSDDAEDPYIVAVPQYNKYGYKEFAFDFDGSGDYEDIHPSLEWLGDSNLIVSAEQLADDGTATAETDNVPSQQTFWIRVNLTFDPSDYIAYGTDSFTIHLNNGMCGGRDFTCIGVEDEGEGIYKLTLKRIEDTSLDLWFPYSDFNISAGDEYVITGIEMPDEYVDGTALNELLPQAISALLENCEVRYKYSLDVDNIQMRRQHENAVTPSDSIYNTISAGMEIYFGDDDLGINYDATTHTIIGNVLIDKLEIKEEDGKLPQFSITLSDEVSIGSIEAIQKQITAIINGGGVVGGAGGGYSLPQILNSIRNYGSTLFLSKTGADNARGFISFLAGINVVGGASGNVAINFENSLSKGTSGAGIWKDASGNWHAQFDYLRANLKIEATEVEIDKISHIGGALFLSATRCIITRTEERSGNILRCYFNAKDDAGNIITNDWKVGDQARVQTFNLVNSQGITANNFWWRLVDNTGTTEDGREHYIDFNVTDSAGLVGSTYADGSGVPAVGDEVVLCGSRAVEGGVVLTGRQNVIILDSAGSGSPYLRIYNGINTFNLGNPRIDLNATDPRLDVSSLTITANGSSKDVGEVIGDSFLVWYVPFDAPMSSGQIVQTLAVDYNGFPADSEGWSESDYAAHLGDIALTTDGVCYRLEEDNLENYVWQRKADDFLIQVREMSLANQKALANMADDSIISRQEKVQLNNLRVQINAEKAQITQEADSITSGGSTNISTANYVSAYNALTAFLVYFGGSLSADTPLVNDSGYTLYAVEHATTLGSPSTYTIQYVNLGSGIQVAGFEYHAAISNYYNQLALLRKAITEGVRDEIQASSETGYDDVVNSYVNALRGHLTISSYTGTMALNELNSIYNALSSWEWTTENGVLKMNGAGLLTTSNFASLWATAYEDDEQMAEAIISAFCKQDSVTGDYYSTIGINATYFIVNTENFKVDRDGNVEVTGDVSAKNFVNKFVTLPALYYYDEGADQYIPTHQIDLYELLTDFYYYIEDGQFKQFKVGSNRNFVIGDDITGVIMTHTTEMLAVCPNGTRLLFINNSVIGTYSGSGQSGLVSSNVVQFINTDGITPRWFLGVSKELEPHGNLDFVALGAFTPVYQAFVGSGLVEFVSIPDGDGKCDWVLTRMSAAYYHYDSSIPL